MSAQSGKATYEWIPYQKLQKASASLWPVDLLIGTAQAATSETPPLAPAPPAGNAPGMRLAQAAPGMQVVCESLQSKTQLVRVVNEGGKCFRETIAPYQGKVERREEVPCSTTCKAPGK